MEGVLVKPDNIDVRGNPIIIFSSNSFSFPVDIPVLAPERPVLSASEYVLFLERYDPASQSSRPFLQEPISLQYGDFPWTVRGVPAGFYRSRIDVILPEGQQTAATELYQIGSPGECTSSMMLTLVLIMIMVLLKLHEACH